MPATASEVPMIAMPMPASPQKSSSLTTGIVSPVGSRKNWASPSKPKRPIFAASWMIGQGVSSRSSHSAAAGRTTPSAKPWTQSRMSFWSWLSSSENSVVEAAGSAAVSVMVTPIVTKVYTSGCMPPATVRAKTNRENDIVAATRALFDAKGAQEAAIDDIARAVGINKALIYRHVGSKEELFVLALTSYLDELRERYVPIDESVDPVATLRAACDLYAGFCLEHPAFLDCALSLMRRPAGELRARGSEGTWLRLGRAMTESLAPLVAILRAAGVTDADYAANRIYVQVLGTMHLARVGAGVTDTADVFAIDPERVRRDCVEDAVALARRSA